MARAHPRRRRVLRVVGIVLGVLVLVGIAVYQVWPYRGVDPFSETPPSLTKTLTHDQAVADLDYAFASIKDRHMATVHGVPEALQRRYEQARDSLPAQPTVLDVWRAVSWLANALADAHTGVSYPATTAASTTFRFDGTTLTIDEPGTPTVLALNGVPVGDLWQRYRQYASYESDQAARNGFADRVRLDTWLRLLGAPASDGITATLASGERVLPTGDVSARGDRSPEVRFEPGMAVLVLHDCTPGTAYTKALDDLFTGARERGLTKVVVDLRDNPGGDSSVTQEFMTHLNAATYRDGGTQVRWGPWVFTNDPSDQPNQRVPDPYSGKVYVLTSSATFSSAVIFTWLLQDNHLAKAVGQSPSNNPNSYGDIVPLRLPNSRLRWIVTYKLFTRANGDTDPTKPLMPDIVTAPGEELAAVSEDA